ncbi:T9SS type A sorting domain-containing protein [Dyadobacter fermentans]|uniref:T9SS type A sorting domain-containing protein n=1 Tax=Dyadobacter fermentans TaxID=94254 RepID=UPI001CBC5DB1|nr:T9SS type A sorting domain-containing protein [Dyadobacter fermentans]MBZ1360771.1 T9SS type A sorting domain-containing protein [Dyadobacter fermentans]
MRKLLRFALSGLLSGIIPLQVHAQTREIQLPTGVSSFTTTVLTNGNFVISSQGYDEPGKSNIGIVLLYDGNTQEVISTLKGEKAGDLIGRKIFALPNGNFVVVSDNWSDGAKAYVGAVTWVNGVTGLNGVVNASNSLIGNTASDQVGVNGITVLSNGNYVVRTYSWRNAGKNTLGAVTWCNGNTGLIGVVSASNSLVGNSTGDYVGWSPVLALPNGNYVVPSPSWDNGGVQNVGAVTWCDGSTGRTGVVGTANSLVGATANERLGGGGLDDDTPRLTALTNGNYVVSSPAWKNAALDSAGAITWCSGTTGRVGVASAANSLIGGSAKDKVGIFKPVALSNGNYVTSSPFWKNGSAENAGAVTWGNGSTGTFGLVSSSNSLVGTDGTDYVGGSQPVTWQIFSLESMGPLETVVPLTNGNYVVISHNWNRNGLKWAGAVTWGNGATGITGAVSPANSLVGTVAMDRVGHLGARALTNGNYVVTSPLWSDGAKLRVGAATWCDGATGRVGEVTAANSFIGTKQDDNIASFYTTALTNGNYVIQSHVNNFNGVEMAGLATWADGATGRTGSPDAGNSLYGTHPNDFVGNYVFPLANGNYVVSSNAWNGTAQYAGALTFANGTTGISGAVSSANSLVGTYASDRIGIDGIVKLPNGDYYVNSREYSQAGAVTWGNGLTGVAGEINDCNSVIGSWQSRYNDVYDYLIVEFSGKIVLYYPTGAPFLSKNSDTGSATINPSQTASLMGGTGCRIIATVESKGASPLTGNVSAKAWLEASVPTYGGNAFVARHYEITPQQNAATATGRVTLYFSQDDFNAFNTAPGSMLNLPANADDASGKANLRVGKYAGTSSDGTGLPGSYPSPVSTIIDPADNDIVWNDTFKRWEVSFDTQGFSGFVLQTVDVPLPVRLVEFSAKPEGKAVKLDWQIADAVNFSHFEIERAADAKQFGAFGKVDFKEGIDSYTLTDGQPSISFDGQAYYRLKMVDKDGSYAFSKILSVQLDGGNVAYVYPNPVVDHFKISLPGYEGKTGNMTLVNASGKVLHSEAFTVKNSEASMDLKKSLLEEGHYIIQLDLGGERRQFKIIRTR